MMDIYSISREPILLRALSLYVPLIICFAALYWNRPNKKSLTGALLASLWAFPALLMLQVLAVQFDWWHFDATGGILRSIPVDLLFGWVMLWAVMPSLLPHSWHSGTIMAGLFLIDLIFMPYLSPVLQLGEMWIVGELFGILLITVPALWIARWTAAEINLIGRVVLQIAIFSALLFWFLPEIGVAWGVVDWSVIWNRPVWQLVVALPLMAIPALIGLTAVQEFAVRGKGTPLPLDPPRRLVTSGIYAYIANPMQFAGSIMLLGFGALLGSFWFLAGAAMACLYSMGIADWSEQSDLRQRHGENWNHYRSLVHKWRFCWKPWRGSALLPKQEELSGGTLYICGGYAFGTKVRIWFEQCAPTALSLTDAEPPPSSNRNRITYESSDGRFVATGVRAIARGLEHIDLRWAMLGFAIRLPMVNQIAQIIVDRYGDEYRLASRTLPI